MAEYSKVNAKLSDTQMICHMNSYWQQDKKQN